MKRLVGAGLLLLLGAGEVQAQAHPYGLAALVNGVEITNATLESSFEEYLRDENVNVAAIRNPGRLKALKREALDLLIAQELVWQAAVAQAQVASPETVDQALEELRGQFKSPDAFKTRLAIEGYTEEAYRAHVKRLVSAREYLERLSAPIEVSDAEVHAFYTENLAKFQVPELVRARHILLRLDPDADDATRRATRERLEQILAEARQGADFAELAKRRSEDATAARGGDLGYFARGRMVAPFADAAFALQPGELSDIVTTPYGLHILRVEDRRPAQLAPEDEAREQILAYLRQQKGQQARDQEIERLRSSAEIEILVPL